MVNLYRQLIQDQMIASLCALNQCISTCPENEWNESHGDYPFSQVVFHTLFYTDFYLARDEASFKNQDFHRNNVAIFRDYEELEDKLPQNLYKKEECFKYLQYLIQKCRDTLKQDNDKTLGGPSGFSFRKFSRAELYVYTIRHIQHHAAQLGLRIQQITGNELKWISSGWIE